MSPVQVNCPSCGAAVGFKIGSSMVTICPYCRSAVARGDRKVEDLGKVAALVDTDSPLEVGLRGKYQGQPFELTGRAQLGHSSGGVWDEWYASFPNEQWGWLAEAQGRFFLTFADEKAPTGEWPEFANLELGQEIPVRQGINFRVAEKGKARMLSAEGEIPYVLKPGRVYEYADLSGPNGAFGTADFGDEPTLYRGQQVTLTEIGISPKARKREAKTIAGTAISCPNCGGALEVRAPESERVGCPNCGALLDCTEGDLKLLTLLDPGKVTPIIPIGTTGTTADGLMTVIGMLERSVTFDGVDYFWEEYLLYEPQIGFRWLVRSDNHWSFVRPVPPGDVGGHGKYRSFGSRTFKLFQKADATVTHVVGECYWKVSVGETVGTADFIAPPQMLSREVTISEDGEEVNWSAGDYLTPAEVEKAFGVSRLPRPSGVAPNQPYLYKKIYSTWGWLMLAAGVLAMLFVVISPRRSVLEKTFVLQAFENADKPQIFLVENVELKGRNNIQVSATAQVTNSYLGVEGDFIKEGEETLDLQPFLVPVEYYFGVDGGESWSEGGQSNYTVLSALPTGTYTLRLEVYGEPGKAPPTFTVYVVQGVPRWLHVILLFLLLSVVPGFMLLYHLNFEHRRWQDSSYSPFGSSD